MGTVADVEEPAITVKGVEKRCFNLVDDMGAWFPCCAVGDNAARIAWSSNMRVVLWFGWARMNVESTRFTMFALPDAFIRRIGLNEVRVTKRVDVSARDEPTGTL